MPTSWIAGALKGFFGITADTNHWAAVKTLMEQSFGTIKVDISIEGGTVHAFFEKQTLLGDDNLRKTSRYKHTITSLDMDEALGSGSSHNAAIVDLWNKVTNLRPHESILQFEELISHGEPHAWYTCFHFKNGQFINDGRTTNECPPARPQPIEKFLEDEKRFAFIAKCEDEVFGRAGQKPA